jgi:hypothetical protein
LVLLKWLVYCRDVNVSVNRRFLPAMFPLIHMPFSYQHGSGLSLSSSQIYGRPVKPTRSPRHQQRP